MLARTRTHKYARARALNSFAIRTVNNIRTYIPYSFDYKSGDFINKSTTTEPSPIFKVSKPLPPPPHWQPHLTTTATTTHTLIANIALYFPSYDVTVRIRSSR